MSLLDENFGKDGSIFIGHYSEIMEHVNASPKADETLLVEELHNTHYKSSFENAGKKIKIIDCLNLKQGDYRSILKDCVDGKYDGFFFDNIDKIPHMTDTDYIESMIRLALKRLCLPYKNQFIHFDDAIIIVRCGYIPPFIQLNEYQKIKIIK